tara:strand:+ start:250 stop:459 length:210 start_codon:yes stop_codon:yes gene_type:complete
MGIREYDFDGYGDIENQRRIKEEKEIQRIALQKNNEELDRICKNICLCVGWVLVLIMFCWVLYLYLFKL